MSRIEDPSGQGRSWLGVALPDKLHNRLDYAVRRRNLANRLRGKGKFYKFQAVEEAIRLWLEQEDRKYKQPGVSRLKVRQVLFYGEPRPDTALHGQTLRADSGGPSLMGMGASLGRRCSGQGLPNCIKDRRAAWRGRISLLNSSGNRFVLRQASIPVQAPFYSYSIQFKTLFFDKSALTSRLGLGSTLPTRSVAIL